MNTSNNNFDRLPHDIRKALLSTCNDEGGGPEGHIEAMRFLRVCSGGQDWTDLEKAHLGDCVVCRTREKRIRHAVSEPGKDVLHDPVMEFTILPDGGLAIIDQEATGVERIEGHAILGSGAGITVQLQRDPQSASDDNVHLAVQCDDTRSAVHLLSLDMLGGEGAVNSFLMLAPGRSGHLAASRSWSAALMAGQVGKTIQLWLEEKALSDVGVFEAELLPEAARLAGREERRMWLAWAEAAMVRVAPSELPEEEILSSLACSDPVRRMHAALICRRVSGKSKELVTRLIERLSDQEERVRFAAVMGLGTLKAALATEPLVRGLEGDEPLIRRAVAKTLGEIGGEKSTGALVEILAADPQAEVREAACQALGRLGDNEAVQELLRAAREGPDKYVQSAAYQALNGIESPDAAEAIAQLHDEGIADSLRDLPPLDAEVPRMTPSEDEVVPAFLLGALYATAAAAISPPADTSAEATRTLRSKAGQVDKSLSVPTIALADDDFAAPSTGEPAEKWMWPAEAWDCEDTARTLAKTVGIGELQAEWSPGGGVLSVWLEGAAEAVEVEDVRWLDATRKLQAQGQGDENGIAELSQAHCPHPGDRLRIRVKSAGRGPVDIEVVFKAK